MLFATLCVLALLASSYTSENSYQFIFPQSTNFPHARLEGTIQNELNNLTLCHWSRIQYNQDFSGIFSYAVDEYLHNHLLTFINQSQHVRFYHQTETPPESTPDVQTGILKSHWLHTCVTWKDVDGSWEIFVNGNSASSGTGLGIMQSVLPDGVVVLGQVQGSPGGGFDHGKSLKGQVSEVHLWDYTLTPEQVKEVARCEIQQEGNVISWHRDSWTLSNGAQYSPVKLPCGNEQ